MSIKQRLIRHAAAEPIYTREARGMIAKVEQALGGGKIALVPCDDYYFIDDDEQLAVDDFEFDVFTGIDEFVEDVSADLDNSDADVLRRLRDKYDDVDEFCKACHTIWVETGAQMWVVTEGESLEAWKKALLKEADKATASASK